MSASALYHGEVGHLRLRPARHRLTYRVFMGLFDLDELRGLSKKVWAFGYNRFGLIRFDDRDHGDGSGGPLRPQIEALLQEADVPFDGGPIRVLCMPRVFGYVFNPLSVYFCFGRDGGLLATVYEVNNTFGERHFYALQASPSDKGLIEQSCDKAFRVSPFLSMNMQYQFRVSPPDETAHVFIAARAADELVLSAWFKGGRRAFSTLSILGQMLQCLALTYKVIAGIHWEALLIWLKLRRARSSLTPLPRRLPR